MLLAMVVSTKPLLHYADYNYFNDIGNNDIEKYFTTDIIGLCLFCCLLDSYIFFDWLIPKFTMYY